MSNTEPTSASAAWCLRTADGLSLARLVDVIRDVADRGGLPIRAAARTVHDALQPMPDVHYFAVSCEDFARPVPRESVFTWCADGSRRLIAHGFDSWCRGVGPAGIDREGMSSQFAMPSDVLPRINGGRPSAAQAAADGSGKRWTDAAIPPEPKADPEWITTAVQEARRIDSEEEASAGRYPPLWRLANQVAELLRARGVHGPRGPLSGESVKRHALNRMPRAGDKARSIAPKRGK